MLRWCIYLIYWCSNEQALRSHQAVFFEYQFELENVLFFLILNDLWFLTCSFWYFYIVFFLLDDCMFLHISMLQLILPLGELSQWSKSSMSYSHIEQPCHNVAIPIVVFLAFGTRQMTKQYQQQQKHHVNLTFFISNSYFSYIWDNFLDWHNHLLFYPN